MLSPVASPPTMSVRTAPSGAGFASACARLWCPAVQSAMWWRFGGGAPPGGRTIYLLRSAGASSMADRERKR
ncbi:hypothetical protein VFPBJ_11132 [Purpureocillium lilacinum]|uniref:Uncharacterized protein n=1 Tax=Purpureocillium lilacinum TaxID=33203 RepID=A0A179FL62_PURLI|nr:hypothetical protein VFPBJ_11132 [Purpureocillium lilacinum]